MLEKAFAFEKKLIAQQARAASADSLEDSAVKKRIEFEGLVGLKDVQGLQGKKNTPQWPFFLTSS